MSDTRSGQRAVLNWRGPLLAAVIFAGAFAILLLMAHQNQSNTSDMGSSFRRDPYGTSLLFDSYERAGYQVQRSPDENSLADLNASQTTAFFIAGYPLDDWEIENGKLQSRGRFRARLETFLARGGRIVLIAPTWGLTQKPQSQDWEVEEDSKPAPPEPGPGWAAPDPRTMPPGSESMYLEADSPWLKTDAHWTALYARAGNAIRGSLARAKADDGSPAHVYMAMRRVGRGELVAASQESFLLNEAIKRYPNPVLLDFLAGGRPTIWVDETLHGLYQDEGVLWLVRRYRLQAALLLLWATLLALLWNMSGDLVRRPARDRRTEIIRQGEGPGVAAQRLLERSIATEQVVPECWEQFRRRSPEDAQTISADPRWGPRLRSALAGPPLAGYRELRHLIYERRLCARGLAQAERQALDRSPASTKTTPEEAPIA
ncbi:MAG TPA: DUF4350 domain-containing protein [Candidatus Cybelea sp.]|nr:DUF4350 domain-containing protein [Candidatus Cybelea sp.]